MRLSAMVRRVTELVRQEIEVTERILQGHTHPTNLQRALRSITLHKPPEDATDLFHPEPWTKDRLIAVAKAATSINVDLDSATRSILFLDFILFDRRLLKPLVDALLTSRNRSKCLVLMGRMVDAFLSPDNDNLASEEEKLAASSQKCPLLKTAVFQTQQNHTEACSMTPREIHNNIYVWKSMNPFAGLGVYAKKQIFPKTMIGPYRGHAILERELDRAFSHLEERSMVWSRDEDKQCAIVALRNRHKYPLSFINDSSPWEIILSEDNAINAMFWPENPRTSDNRHFSRCMLVGAIRPIDRNKEIFASYGEELTPEYIARLYRRHGVRKEGNVFKTKRLLMSPLITERFDLLKPKTRRTLREVWTDLLRELNIRLFASTVEWKVQKNAPLKASSWSNQVETIGAILTGKRLTLPNTSRACCSQDFVPASIKKQINARPDIGEQDLDNILSTLKIERQKAQNEREEKQQFYKTILKIGPNTYIRIPDAPISTTFYNIEFDIIRNQQYAEYRYYKHLKDVFVESTSELSYTGLMLFDPMTQVFVQIKE